ncbi:unnamed protein product [Malus baccata var. baccata]
MGDLEKQETVLLKKAEETAEGEEKERLLEEVEWRSWISTCSARRWRCRPRASWRPSSRASPEERKTETQGTWVASSGCGKVKSSDCFDDRRVALESLCCPCYRFGKNMRRAGFGPCSLQGALHLILVVLVLLNGIAFIVTKKHCFLYLAVAFSISLGTYLGYFRTQIKKKFNIRGSDSSLDDCIYHLICPCCALCQESRTLEMNNVQDGTWHGRGLEMFNTGDIEKSKLNGEWMNAFDQRSDASALKGKSRGVHVNVNLDEIYG